jgi:hypothetical protein
MVSLLGGILPFFSLLAAISGARAWTFQLFDKAIHGEQCSKDGVSKMSFAASLAITETVAVGFFFLFLRLLIRTFLNDWPFSMNYPEI